MSWMDSWSRPSKSSATPPPLYLTSGGEQVPYCHTCGRVISTRRSHTPASHSTQVKYCSERCRHNKPTDADRKIEDAFVAILNNDLAGFKKKYDVNTSLENQISEKRGQAKKMKGDSRVIVLCSEVEELIFGSRHDPSRNAGRKKDRKPRGVPDAAVWKSVDMEDDPPERTYTSTATRQDVAQGTDSHESDDSEDGGIDLSLANYSVDQDHIKLEVDSEHKNFGAGKRRPAQENAVVNGSVGGEKGWAEKIEESEEMLQKRRQGQRRAEEKEMVRRAARRGVAFGFVVEGREESQHEVIVKVKSRKKKQDDDDVVAISKRDPLPGKESRKKCEAVMTKAAVVVEPSYAKGDWGIRWREEV